MQFRVERVFLTDQTGRTVSPGLEMTWHVVDAGTVDEVIDSFARTERAELVGSVLRFAGQQAVATLRAARRVFTLQIDATTVVPRS